jgi:hypothetical protein
MATTSATASQKFVPIKEIRDGIAILKDGTMRGMVIVSSINFALKSEDAQQAIIYQFQNFLNALDFPVQIYIQSRRLDIRPYIALLEDRYKEQTIDLLKLQTREYIEFIKKFTENTNIMTKSFFVVVPFTPAIVQGGKGSIIPANPFTSAGQKQSVQNKIDNFEENKSQLEQRISVIESGLSRCGLRSFRLGTDEITELFYRIFNPGDTDKPIQLHN